MRQSCGPKCLVDARGQMRMGRLIQADRRATLTEITFRYNRGMQQSIYEATTCPHRVPLISTTNRKKRQQFARAHQNCTVEDCKNVAWSDESRFLLRHSDGRVMPCYCAGWWWCCNGVRDVFLAHFRPLSTNWALFKCHSLPEHCFCPCPSLYGHHVPIL